MNKTILSAILIISLLITGCAGEDTKESCSDDVMNQDETDIDCGGTCSPCADGKDCETDDDCANKCSTLNKICYTATTSTTQRKAQPKETELSEETQARVEEKLTHTTKYIISEHFVTLNKGDSHIFGLGVINAYAQDTKFRISIEFDKANDARSNTLIGVDEEVLIGWLDKTEFITTLAPDEKIVWPVKLTIGKEIGDGVPVDSNTYYNYNVRVYYGDVEVTTPNREYLGKQPMALRIR